MEKQNSNNNNKKRKKKIENEKMTCVGGGFKQEKNFLDCRTWNELLENIKKNTHKKKRG